MLRHLQRRLESIYDVESGHNVEDFLLVDREVLQLLAGAQSPPERCDEMLLVRQSGEDEMQLSLFIDASVLERLGDGADPLTADQLHDYCLTTEGVSHFVFLIFRAFHGHSVTQLELELQAEIDKFLSCCLDLASTDRPAGDGVEDNGKLSFEEIETRLFEGFEINEAYDQGTQDRYRVASRMAHRYVRQLSRRFIRPRRPRALVRELRTFYRLSQQQKLRRIDDLAQAA